MLANILDFLPVYWDAHPRHLAILVHSLIAELIVEQCCANTIHLILLIHLAVEDIVLFFDSVKFSVQIEIFLLIKFVIVIREYRFWTCQISELELELMHRVLNAR